MVICIELYNIQSCIYAVYANVCTISVAPSRSGWWHNGRTRYSSSRQGDCMAGIELAPLAVCPWLPTLLSCSSDRQLGKDELLEAGKDHH